MNMRVTMERVVVSYTSLCGPGMFCDSAKAMAPLSPANQITPCIFQGIFCFRTRLHMNDNGNTFNILPRRQKTMARTTKVWSHVLKRPVKKPVWKSTSEPSCLRVDGV